MLPPHWFTPKDSIADPGAVVTAPGARFTVLTSRLVRMEFNAAGHFEDRASQAFWHRRQPVPEFEVRRSERELQIVTPHLRLRWSLSAAQPASDALSVELIDGGAIWRYGDRDTGNLLGTARTLDNVRGRTRLEPGLMSTSGWAVVDDSRSLVFEADGWLSARAEPDAIDLYFFGYGREYADCLRDFGRVAGRPPVLPRWALGNWWSRFWEYSQAELLNLMHEFRRHDVPLSVCIVDMDWHVTRTDSQATGWTGYTWNSDLFPEPRKFLEALHALGLKTALNLHPAEGVHPHEAAYPAMAERLGVEPESRAPIPFDLADPRFARGYFEILHHPLEELGVDFWWLDWQQGTTTRLAGLDPLWWLNHLHFHDLARDGIRRPFVFSRWGGLGHHRYPIGFSGDTHVTWEALAFQPYFTATAANVGYGWWSHDIGGHMLGTEDPELFVRWVQWGVFSPIFRLHSTKNGYHERRPWGWDAETARLTRAAMQLRHALIPYLYTLAWRNARENLPPLTPMYYWHVEADAYRCPNQYYFGSELIAAPFAAPSDRDTRLSRAAVWLPPGDWYHFLTGDRLAGGRWLNFYGDLGSVPVFAKAGAIVPLGPRVGWGGVDNPSRIELHVFAGADNWFDLYEDDGATTAYQSGRWATTRFVLRWQPDELTLTVGPIEGDAAVAPPQRTYALLIHGVARPDTILVAVNGQPRQAGTDYEDGSATCRLADIALKAADELRVSLRRDAGPLLAEIDHRARNVRQMLRAFRLETEMKGRLDSALPELLREPDALSAHAARLTDSQLAALREALRP